MIGQVIVQVVAQRNFDVNNSNNQSKTLIKMVHPFLLLFSVIIYSLGGGVARYTGSIIDWSSYIWGQLWILTLLFSAFLLNFYFEENRIYSMSGNLPKSFLKIPGISDHQISFWGGVTSLIALVPVTILLIINQKVSLPVGGLMVFMLFIMIAYVVPPLRLAETGYGEIIQSIGMVFLIPLLAFFLQTDVFPRIILLISFPLIFSYLVMLLSFELRNYVLDIQLERNNLLVLIGWQNGIYIIISSTILCYLFLIVVYFIGMPRFVLTVGIILFPVGLTLVWLILRISYGFRPQWKLLTTTSYIILGLMSYFFALRFWTY